MLRKVLSFTFICAMAVSSISTAQNLDGKPYDPAVDPNVDMFMGNWKYSMPRHSHGSLIERDILTKGDNMNPVSKGAVMKYTNRFAHATLEGNASTTPTTLTGEQEIFYFLSGSGTIDAGGKTADLHTGIAVLMPEGLEFTIKNTGSEQLTMYLISEPVPEGFTPLKNMLVKDELSMPIGGSNWHWAHIGKSVFSQNEGLATLYSVLTIGFAPMTISHPHSHDPGCEEVWTGIYGTTVAFIGKQIRMQPPGTAYNIPPDSKTPHCNLNTSDTQAKLLYFSVRKDIDGTGL